MYGLCMNTEIYTEARIININLTRLPGYCNLVTLYNPYLWEY